MARSVTSICRGMGVLLLFTLMSEISANRSTWHKGDYTWLVVCAGILAFIAAYGIGANDVANAMGPFSAVYLAYQKGAVLKSYEFPDATNLWILALGGAGIVVGLATYGYKIMNAMGVKLVTITPSRGYCIELGAAFVIIYGTAQGWPLSTTHCQIGATVAVGLFEGAAGVNGRLFAKTCFGWIITIVVAGLTAALLVGPSPEPLKDEYCDPWALNHYDDLIN
mmetsp:Transcript_1770/g.5321  ORF Transcript_1770/g.5321 Transcript_1770/m.5321 type:complete len:223 (-) Transcript_1770:70-738(-)